MTRFFVAIGSNLGDRPATIRSAVEAMAALPGVIIGRRSHVWQTRPLGPGSGPFLNAAVELLCTDVEPAALLASLLEIERRHGRERRERWGDRTLDLDLLCGYAEDGGELVIDVPGLTLPHPGFGARDFVLQPLVDIDPGLLIRGRPSADWLAALADEDRTVLGRFDAEPG
ncbi:MAG TPA: 2-amino-4-hydroxy-6-hydroxymethyldihydropteridine diphosphokinase [Enhygromyxa sp.]|nr:2-amino-4-hydroxy-6-hydroxymethyldihydropteridine diphosphokinase [Enhygromyxa sp.]